MNDRDKTTISEEKQKYQAYRHSGVLERIVDAVDMLIHHDDEFVVSENWRHHCLSFSPEEWCIENHPARVLTLAFNSTPGFLRIQLTIDKSSTVDGLKEYSLRQAWLDYALSKAPLFTPSSHKLSEKGTTLYSYTLLGPYPPDITTEEIEEKMQSRWEDFKTREYPELTRALAQFMWQN